MLSQTKTNLRSRILLCATTAFFLLGSTALSADDHVLFENLEPLEGAKAAFVEIDPDADFGAFKRVRILDTFVAFQSGWERQHSRAGSRLNVSHNDMEKIKAGVADLFKQVFTEVLEADNGYEVVEENGEDVILLRPAIIDLNIVAPDTSVGRNTTFTAETGAATIYIELYDSSTNQILGRAADRRTIRNGGDLMTWTNRATNTAAAKKLLKAYAQALRDFLDTHYTK